ncbi:MAG TPA: histidinol-phosphate transaminase [Rhizomicrobium sp.]|nr:histidinol-phosphate transaminase [Rhizomicrobium sp.]
MKPAPKPGVLEIAPYVGGRAHAPGAVKVFKLSSNESALGPSPLGLEAYREAAAGIDIYPEGSAKILREAIAETYGLNADRIVCGNGSDELLTLLAHAYLHPGDEVIFSAHAFLVYHIATLANSATPVVVPEPKLRVDVDAMLKAVTSRTRLVYLANPNNPTGSYLTSEEVRRLHAGLPSNVILVIDAAYAEYVRKNDYDTGVELVSQFHNVVMTRTFSKIYGLAGLRVGWAFCPPEVADVLNRIRGPFNVSVPAQRAAAAALRDRAHIEASVAHNEKWKDWLVEHIRKLGLRVDDSVGNFVLIHFANPATAKKADEFLTARGIILRPVGAYGLPSCLRLTIGTEEANRETVKALSEFVKS